MDGAGRVRCYLGTAVIYAIVNALAVGERARVFKATSPGVLPPLGILFGLFVAFTAAQVWSDTERADAAVTREAGALGSVIVLTASFPDEPRERVGELIRRYIMEAAAEEWPAMARHSATLKVTPPTLAEALQLSLGMTPQNQGQEAAQRQIAAALENALDARRQRIVVSLSQVNFVKWAWLADQAICIFVAIAMVHVDNRRASAIVMAIFATGVAVSVLLITAHNRPFTGEISVGPGPLLQLLSEGKG
jgi:Protein of unknown function (DUF4239)